MSANTTPVSKSTAFLIALAVTFASLGGMLGALGTINNQLWEQIIGVITVVSSILSVLIREYLLAQGINVPSNDTIRNIVRTTLDEVGVAHK
jgi:hypothetical protein